MIKSRLFLWLLLLSALTIFPGCWSQVEIEDLAIVRSLTIDYLPDRRAPFMVSLAVVRPADIAGGGDAGAGGSGESPTRLFAGVGATIDLALQQISQNLSRQLFLSHCEVVLISEDAARHGLHSVIDFILRNPEMRLSLWPLVVPGVAHDILVMTERLETTITDEILGLLAQSRKSSEADPQEAFKIIRQLSTPGQDTHIPVLRISPHIDEEIPELDEKRARQEHGPEQEDEETEEQNGQGAQELVEPKIELTLAGTAAFRGDVLAGFLDPVETRGFLWLANGVTQTIINVHDPTEPERKVSLLVSEANVKITPVINGDRIGFRVEILAEGDIASQRSQSDLSTPEMIKLLNSAMAAVIKIDIEKALQKMQELDTDLVGFGAMLNRTDPQTFRRLRDHWPEVFRELNFDIHVTANIRRTGQLSRPVPMNR